ncbi:hypothetical protein Droror1_Dr00027666 [Drosera rotundifolia]
MVEFNKAAQSLAEAVVPNGQKKNALHRLIKENVALIVVVEAKFNHQGADNLGKQQLLCVVIRGNSVVTVEALEPVQWMQG